MGQNQKDPKDQLLECFIVIVIYFTMAWLAYTLTGIIFKPGA